MKIESIKSNNAKKSIEIKVNEKIRDLALNHLLKSKLEKNDIANIGASVIKEFISSFFMPKKGLFNLKQSSKKKKLSNYRQLLALVGISPNSFNSWINAFMQFVLFVPSISSIFNFLPNSFNVFIKFLDEYKEDLLDGFDTTSATTENLIKSLYEKFPNQMQNIERDKFIDFSKVLDFFFKLIPKKSFLKNLQFSNLLSLYPERFLIVKNFIKDDFQTFLEKYISKNLEKNLLEIVLCISQNQNDIKEINLIEKFFFDNYFYELDAFIEFRNDYWSSPSYITYIKKENCWFQCHDLRITKIEKNDIFIPISRSLLFHYKRINYNNLLFFS